MALFNYGSVYPRRQYGFYPGDFLAPFERNLDLFSSVVPNYLLSDAEWRDFKDLEGVEKKSLIGKDGFQVSLDVQHFLPNEINVRTENNSVVINAKHLEKPDDHGYISREFTRRYELPDGFKSEDVTSTLSSDGILTIKAPRRIPGIEGNVRQVQIHQTGPARLNVVDNKGDDNNDKEINNK